MNTCALCRRTIRGIHKLIDSVGLTVCGEPDAECNILQLKLSQEITQERMSVPQRFMLGIDENGSTGGTMLTTKLTQNINVLTRAHVVRHIDNETGESTYPQEIALFEQLQTEIGSSSRRGGQSGSGSRSPVALGAVALWAEIQESLNTSYIAITGTDCPQLSAEKKLTAWIQAAQDAHTIINCVETTSKWIDQIRELLSPEPTLELIGACPACGNTHVHTEQDGETLRNVALTATINCAQCAACGAEWEPAQFEQLRDMIG